MNSLSNGNQSSMQLPVICEQCDERFIVNTPENPVTFKKKYEVNGQTIFLSYYDCPKCGRRHFVQIDNASTLAELWEAEQVFVKLSVIKLKGKTPTQSQSVKFKKIREHLARSRNKLMKQYTGSLIHDSETDADFELRFSV